MQQANCDIPLLPPPNRRPWYKTLLIVSGPVALFAVSGWVTWNLVYSTNLVALAPTDADTIILLKKTARLQNLVESIDGAGELAPGLPVSLNGLLADSRLNAAIYLNDGQVIGLSNDNSKGNLAGLETAGFEQSTGSHATVIKQVGLTSAKRALRRPYFAWPNSDGLTFTDENGHVSRIGRIKVQNDKSRHSLTFYGQPLGGDGNQSPVGSDSIASLFVRVADLQTAAFTDIALNYPGIKSFFTNFQNEDASINIFSDETGFGLTLRAPGRLSADDSERLARDLLAYAGSNTETVSIEQTDPTGSSFITVAKTEGSQVSVGVSSSGTVVSTRSSDLPLSEESPTDVAACLKSATGYLREIGDLKIAPLLPTTAPPALLNARIVAGNSRITRLCW